jgi:lipid-A-disaccharide synthase-like uncharacterized protein
MDLGNLVSPDGKLFGIQWSVWKVIGWLGNAVFFSRFFVQWYATEKLKRVVVPTAFWWLSLLGSLLLLSYALFNKHMDCLACGTACPPHSKFCYACGHRLELQQTNDEGPRTPERVNRGTV